MKELLLYTVAAFGLAYIIGHSKISLPLRLALEPADEKQVARAWLVMLLECPACLGFWIGLSFTYFTGFSFGFPLPGFLAALGLAAYTSGSNFLLSAWGGLLWGGADDERD